MQGLGLLPSCHHLVALYIMCFYVSPPCNISVGRSVCAAFYSTWYYSFTCTCAEYACISRVLTQATCRLAPMAYSSTERVHDSTWASPETIQLFMVVCLLQSIYNSLGCLRELDFVFHMKLLSSSILAIA